MNPKGGTEIQLEELTKRLPKHYWNKISITTSVPEKTQIDPSRLNILWQKIVTINQIYILGFKTKACSLYPM